MQRKPQNQKILDIYITPKFYKKQLVYDGRKPLTVYKNPISCLNNQIKIDQDTPYEADWIRNIGPGDGMIYELQQISKNGQGIKMLVCVTMYNEEEEFIQRTINGIWRNVVEFKKMNLHPRQIAVVIIQDGILKLCNSKSRKMTSAVDFFINLDKQMGNKKSRLLQRINTILDENDLCHKKGQQKFIFGDIPPSIPRFTSLLYQTYYRPKEVQGDQPYLQLLTCFKHLNGKKLSSHMWFFQGFCRLIKPQYCAVVDVGIEPQPFGLVNFVRDLDSHPQVGGVCGFIDVDLQLAKPQIQDYTTQQDRQKNMLCDESPFAILCYPLPILSTIGGIFIYIWKFTIFLIGKFFLIFTYIHNLFSCERTQLFQYCYAQMLDKNAESLYGFLSVLPGAWSAYRYIALSKASKYQQSILQKKYLVTVLDPDRLQKDYRQANMYLGQDRILSLGIYCKPDSKYSLRYIPDAIASADPLPTLNSLMGQRRRWINSTYYAFEYVFRNYPYEIDKSQHGCATANFTLPLSMWVTYLTMWNVYLIPSFFFFALFNATYGWMTSWTLFDAEASKQAEQSSVKLLHQTFPAVRMFPIMMCFFYVVIIFVLIGTSLNYKLNDPFGKKVYMIISAILGLYNLSIIAILTVYILYSYIIESQSTDESLESSEIIKYLFIGMSAAFVGFQAIVILMHLPTHFKQILNMLHPYTLISYLYYQGAYIHTLVIYSFCNIDDVSWGTKGLGSDNETNTYYNHKVQFVKNWMLANAVVAFLLVVINQIYKQGQSAFMILILGIYATLLLTVKSVSAILNHMTYLFYKCCLGCKPQMFNEQRYAYLQRNSIANENGNNNGNGNKNGNGNRNGNGNGNVSNKMIEQANGRNPIGSYINKQTK